MKHDAFQVSPDFIGTNSQRFNSLRAQPAVALLVPLWTVAEIMGQAVNFDSDTSSFAVEIQNEWSERVLPSEL